MVLPFKPDTAALASPMHVALRNWFRFLAVACQECAAQTDCCRVASLGVASKANVVILTGISEGSSIRAPIWTDQTLTNLQLSYIIFTLPCAFKTQGKVVKVVTTRTVKRYDSLDGRLLSEFYSQTERLWFLTQISPVYPWVRCITQYLLIIESTPLVHCCHETSPFATAKCRYCQTITFVVALQQAARSCCPETVNFCFGSICSFCMVLLGKQLPRPSLFPMSSKMNDEQWESGWRKCLDWTLFLQVFFFVILLLQFRKVTVCLLIPFLTLGHYTKGWPWDNN